MKKIMITGISGFVGHHFIQYLYDNEIELDICGVDVNVPNYDLGIYRDRLQISFKKINLLEIESIRDVFKEFTPDYILHLASFSSVAYSWEHPENSFVNNTNLFLNLLTVVGEVNKKCRILSVGSSEEYGNVTSEDIPIKERLRVRPSNPYAVARVSQELLSMLYVDSFGYDIVMTRSFNHIGPWQDSRFVVPSFINRIKCIKESGYSEGTIETGDTNIVRDFVDVRDVVHAYYLLLMKGRKGSIYNICSGKGTTLGKIVDLIADIMGVKINTRVNAQYVRPNDNPIIIGENFKIYNELGWKPQIPLDKTIEDMIV